jgi:hypothetical protein
MLKVIFGPRTFLEEGLETWCLEAWAWLMRNLGGTERLAATPLVLADKRFFPPTETEGEARAAYLFEHVRALMGMGEWACELQPVQRRTETRVGEYWFLKSDGGAAGTFQVAGNQAVICYAADLVKDPRSLIAVFAHELCHYLQLSVGEPAPGGMKAHELLTELAVAYCGFGVFAANAAFAFEQHQDAFGQGWSSRRQGYFSERTWAFAIALFLTLKGERPDLEKALKPTIAEMVGKALRYLEKNPGLVEPLRAIA